MLEFLEKQNPKDLRTGEMQFMFQEDLSSGRGKTLRKADQFTRNNNFNGTSLPQYSLKCLSHLARIMEISQGAFFITDVKDSRPVIRFVAGFASKDPADMQNILEIGDGLPGRVARDGKIMNITTIPEGYVMIESGLGKASPVSLLIFPVKYNGSVIAVIELSSFHEFTAEDEHFFKIISPSIAEQIIKCRSIA